MDGFIVHVDPLTNLVDVEVGVAGESDRGPVEDAATTALRDAHKAQTGQEISPDLLVVESTVGPVAIEEQQ